MGCHGKEIFGFYQYVRVSNFASNRHLYRDVAVSCNSGSPIVAGAAKALKMKAERL